VRRHCGTPVIDRIQRKGQARQLLSEAQRPAHCTPTRVRRAPRCAAAHMVGKRILAIGLASAGDDRVEGDHAQRDASGAAAAAGNRACVALRRNRRHGSNGDLSPVEFDKRYALHGWRLSTEAWAIHRVSYGRVMTTSHDVERFVDLHARANDALSLGVDWKGLSGRSRCRSHPGGTGLRVRSVVMLVLLTIVALVLSTAAIAADNTAGFIVPAYGNPCCAGGITQWSSLATLGSAQPNRLVVITAPTFGSSGHVDPNYVFANGTGPLVTLLNTGARVIGYVNACTRRPDCTSRTLAEVYADIDLYYSPAYWNNHPIQLKGVFFDLMSPDLQDVGFYQQLRDRVVLHDPAAWIVGNPGAAGTVNPSNQTTYSVNDYANVFNTLMVAEVPESSFRSDYTAPSWANVVDPSSLAMVVYDAPTASRMHSDLSLALQRRAGWVFITNDTIDGTSLTPYDTVPSYWTDEVALLPQLIFANDFE